MIVSFLGERSKNVKLVVNLDSPQLWLFLHSLFCISSIQSVFPIVLRAGGARAFLSRERGECEQRGAYSGAGKRCSAGWGQGGSGWGLGMLTMNHHQGSWK